ncbi:MAG: hypothetical protein KDD55_13505, partial [Bdellovibrionales bacterium]|nr:hypothetical protein [Bdellovibrionales bacterium]
PISSYSTSDTNLTASDDALQDSLGDTDADTSNTVTFRVDVTDCLSSVAQTLDVNDELTLDLQFRNDVGDNAAQKLCIKRIVVE